MEHGAVIHHSKEQMILSGRYNKPLGKRTYQKLRKCGVKNTNITYSDIINKKCLKDDTQNEQSQDEESINKLNGTASIDELLVPFCQDEGSESKSCNNKSTILNDSFVQDYDKLDLPS